MAHKHLNDAERINTEILQEWLTGRGKQPVTWATLVKVLCDIKLSVLAGEIHAIVIKVHYFANLLGVCITTYNVYVYTFCVFFRESGS